MDGRERSQLRRREAAAYRLLTYLTSIMTIAAAVKSIIVH